MADNDTLGTGLDMLAGPLAGALFHSKEYMEKADTIVEGGGMASDGVDAATMGAAKMAEEADPVVPVVEGGMKLAKAENELVHGDTKGAIGDTLTAANPWVGALFHHYAH
jgi:hypothetical protein